MSKPKMLGYNKQCNSGSTHYAKAPWQGAKKKPKKVANPVRLIFFDEMGPYPPKKK